MNATRILKLSALAVALLLTLMTGPVDAGQSTQAATVHAGFQQAASKLLQQSPGAPRPIVRYSTRNDVSAPVHSIRPIPPRAGNLLEIPRKTLPNRQGSTGPSGSDPVLQPGVGGVSAPSTSANFEGINNRDGVLPPDTNGDVGPNHYVQIVNLSFAIWNKSGALLYGPASINTLWQGFGGPCETTNDGDPIALYDHLADRWLISQFALPSYPFGPFYQCIAVSKTFDPTDAFYRYEFLISNNKLNDYPKFGVWPDGYYMSINQFKQVSMRWGGQGAVAFERDQMLNGQPARMVYFDLEKVDSNLGGMLPSDLDGPVPPAGSPNYFAQIDDNAWGYSPDQLQIWAFHTDWNNPNNSTFTRSTVLPTAAFDSNMCGYSRNCIPQPGGTNVDAISDRLMYRLQYRNFSGVQRMVVNHTVDVNGSDHAGIRWYELRNSGSGWSIYQQGSYAPDSDHRWMGSVAMDGSGDIALGYSVSSTSTYPSIRYTGRLPGDTLGQMTQGEGTIINGSGYQTHSSGRWGDYSMLAVDPVDDCTFWYTQEYYQVVGNAPWQTRIGSFKFPSCGSTAGVSITPQSQTGLDFPGGSVSYIYSVTNTGNQADTYALSTSSAWSSSVSPTSLTLSAGASANVTVTHNVPTNASPGDSDTGTLSATSSGTGASDSSTFTTTARGYAVDITPNSQSSSGAPGDTVGYVYTVTNTGTEPDTYDISASSAWSSSVSPTSLTLAAGASADVTVSHMIPTTANNGDSDSGTVSVVSSNASDSATFTTTASVTVGVSVDSIAPDSVAAGGSVDVIISGSGFQSGANVTFENGSGPAPTASNVTFVDSGTITATVTTKSGGPPRNRVWDVHVTNPDGSTGVLAGGFTVTP